MDIKEALSCLTHEVMGIMEALYRLPREVINVRNRRLRWAMELSMKHIYLPEDLQGEWRGSDVVTIRD